MDADTTPYIYEIQQDDGRFNPFSSKSPLLIPDQEDPTNPLPLDNKIFPINLTELGFNEDQQTFIKRLEESLANGYVFEIIEITNNEQEHSIRVGATRKTTLTMPNRPDGMHEVSIQFYPRENYATFTISVIPGFELYEDRIVTIQGKINGYGVEYIRVFAINSDSAAVFEGEAIDDFLNSKPYGLMPYQEDLLNAFVGEQTTDYVSLAFVDYSTEQQKESINQFIASIFTNSDDVSYSFPDLKDFTNILMFISDENISVGLRNPNLEGNPVLIITIPTEIATYRIDLEVDADGRKVNPLILNYDVGNSVGLSEVIRTLEAEGRTELSNTLRSLVAFE